MNLNPHLLQSILNALKHIKSVEEGVIGLSQDSTLKFHESIEKSDLKIDDNIIEVMQHQDIVAQQLSATIEAIDITIENLEKYKSKINISLTTEILNNLSIGIDNAIEDAQIKQEAFGGKVLNKNIENSEVEFF